MGYPVPDKPFSQEFAYFLVAIPNEVEFIRAARTAYTELSDVWKWGEEKTHPDAAEIRQLWLNAATRTYELMGWPETLLSHVDEIEPLLRLLQSALEAQTCCDVVPGADNLVGAHEGELDTSDTDIANDVVPSPYVDAADFLANYHCRASVYMADTIIQWPSEVTRAVGGGISGVIAAIIILTGGAFLSIGLVPLLTLATLTGIVTAIADLSEAWGNLTEDTPTAAETLLLARRQDIICAIYQANDAEGAHSAVAAIVGEELSAGWTNLFLLWPWGSAIAKVFNGDSEAPTVAASECLCVQTSDLFVQVDAGDSFTTISGGPESLPWVFRVRSVIDGGEQALRLYFWETSAMNNAVTVTASYTIVDDTGWQYRRIHKTEGVVSPTDGYLPGTTEDFWLLAFKGSGLHRIEVTVTDAQDNDPNN